MICYWSRTFKFAELIYSVTEQESLAGKEGIIKFLSYIDGE